MGEEIKLFFVRPMNTAVLDSRASASSFPKIRCSRELMA
jgi:hypothetical protein